MTTDRVAAEIVGLCFGDGSLTRRQSGNMIGQLRFQLRGDIIEDREHYCKHIIPVFNSKLGNFSEVESRGKTKSFGISSGNQKVCNGIGKLGVPCGEKGELRIPEWILDNKEYTKAFLRGYFDTDGSIYCGRNYTAKDTKHTKLRVNYTSTSKALIEDVSHSLLAIGIHHLVIRPYQPKQANTRITYRIQIDGPNAVNFMKIVGSRNPKHITKYQIWETFGYCPPHTKLADRKAILDGRIKPDSFYSTCNSQ